MLGIVVPLVDFPQLIEENLFRHTQNVNRRGDHVIEGVSEEGHPVIKCVIQISD